jgi:basic membrane lipoprotein Med (substrate-binding protein (PBP1-ABC) superfamily)
LIVSNSYGHQDYMAPAAKDNPDATFISMTGDYAENLGKNQFQKRFRLDLRSPLCLGHRRRHESSKN